MAETFRVRDGTLRGGDVLRGAGVTGEVDTQFPISIFTQGSIFDTGWSELMAGNYQLVSKDTIYGGTITAQGTADMTVTVTGGAVNYANIPVTFGGTTLTIGTADASYDRVDLIAVNSGGTAYVVPGSAMVGLAALPPTTSDVVLAEIYVFNQSHYSYGTAITQDVITDRRTLGLIHLTPYRVSGLWYGPQGVLSAQQLFSVSDSLKLVPFFVGRQFDVDAIGIRVGTAGGAGTVARLGLYRDDDAGMRTLVVDAGTVACDSTGDKTLSIVETLTPGWWWGACVLQSISGSPRLWGFSGTGLVSPVGLDSFSGGVGGIKQEGVSGVLPDTITPDYTAPLIPMVWVRAA